MGEPSAHQPLDGQSFEAGGLIVSSLNGTDLVGLAPETQIATMRQMMESLFSRIEAVEQKQAVQLAGVHDRLDAVELELPLVQEQSALRIHDLEKRVAVQMEEAIGEAVAGRFGSLAAQLESQQKELAQLRESKKQAESRLDRAVQDIERLCGDLPAAPRAETFAAAAAAPASQFRPRIAEHIRKAAVEAAPDQSNPLLGEPGRRLPAELKPALKPIPIPPPTPAPRFDDWKRQFMQDGQPVNATLLPEADKSKIIVCPLCHSERTRPATATVMDGVFRLAGLSPYRCRACAHRFYKRGVVPAEETNPEQTNAETSAERRSEVMETR